MGSFLDKPRTEKQTEEGEGNGLRFGLSSMQGWRIKMEDRHCAVVGLPQLKDWSFFAVFDGHAGARVAAHCAENLLNTIIGTESFRENAVTLNKPVSKEQIESLKEGIREGFLQLDEKMKKLPKVESGEDKSGTTAICAFIARTHIFIANLGDSRAVLSRSGKRVFSTTDHKPINPEEKERIQKAGGNVMIQRVNGSLAVSRALGDYEYKQVEGKNACEQLVSPMPEVSVEEQDNADEFLVLACDGIWDVMSNDDLCDFIRHQLSIYKSLGTVCSSVIDTCLHKGSKDNMSVVLVTFAGAPTVSEEAIKKDKELNDLIEKEVQKIMDKNNESAIADVMEELIKVDFKDLPPGGGIDSKRTFIEEIIKNINQNKNSNSNVSDQNNQ
jgi:protein phosphatase 1B